MTMASWEFAATGPVQAEIKLPAGSVRVAAVKTSTVTVTLLAAGPAGERLIEQTEVSFEAGSLAVRVPEKVRVSGNAALDLKVELPEGSRLTADTASADLLCSGELGGLSGKTASGDVNAGRVRGDVALSTASGDIRLADTTGDVRLETASGEVVIERADGEIIAKTASGGVTVVQAGMSVTIRTASGDVRVDSIVTGLADVSSISGDITLAVVPGATVYLDISTLSGHVSSELDSSADAEREPELTLTCQTLSGDIRITRAAADPVH
jgi:Putative adhesin